VDHRRQELDVDDVGELAWFLKTVESVPLHALPGDLVRDLISPFVDYWHVDVVYEDRHLLSTRRTVGSSDAFVDVALDDALEEVGGRCRREVDGL